MQARARMAWVDRSAARWVVLGVCIAAGLAVRAALYHVQTGDYTFFVSRWYDFLAQNGGFLQGYQVIRVVDMRPFCCAA